RRRMTASRTSIAACRREASVSFRVRSALARPIVTRGFSIRYTEPPSGPAITASEIRFPCGSCSSAGTLSVLFSGSGDCSVVSSVRFDSGSSRRVNVRSKTSAATGSGAKAGFWMSTPPAVAMPTSPVGMPTETDSLSIAPDTPQRATQLPRTVIDYDHALLTDSERQVVAKLIEASKQIDEIFLRQVSEDNPSMRGRLAKQAAAPSATPLDRAGYDYFIINKGPWNRPREDEPSAATAK